MTLIIQSHGGTTKTETTRSRRALPPAAGDVSVDESADFGFLFPPSGNPGDYLPDDAAAEIDQLADLMVPAADPANPEVTPDSALPPVLTYWGQFLDHELTARTDRESQISTIAAPAPHVSAAEIETTLKNARTPRFDLDSVYGGVPVGVGIDANMVKVISGMRHPGFPAKMRVGTAFSFGPLPDGLDPHRDLPRFSQVGQEVRDAFLATAQAQMSPAAFAKLQAGLPGRAIIGDMRNDENLIVAQFHLSFLRFHNRVVDFLTANDTGWIADYDAAKTLTKLHYQWLIVGGYLDRICDPAVLQRVRDERARHFFDFRAAYNGRVGATGLGNALPLEFSVAAFRFGHTMVRDRYDYNKNFGRPGTGQAPNASFEQIFHFTGGGGFEGAPRVPENWIIDWSRFVTADPSTAGGPARTARALDTLLAPPLGDMVNEANDEPDPDVKALFRHLARRNLRRGLSLRLPTGQALHAHLKSIGALTTDPIHDIATALDGKPELAEFLRNSPRRLFERTPLWFYILAEAEATGGNRLGELGSWIVASTFIATLLSDAASAESTGFTPEASPLRTEDGDPIDSIARWMKFALVLE